MVESEWLLQVQNLTKHFPVRKGWLARKTTFVRAVDDVSFNLRPNQTLGLVGESGCGKSTVGRAVLRLIRATSGRVLFEGEDILTLDAGPMRRLRRRMQIIFQDPFGSLNPRMTVERIVEEPLLTHGAGNRAERREKVAAALETVGLRPEYMKRFPHEFSGGQRQRIMIARALIMSPALVVADEPVSALDVSVQAQILNLMVRLQKQFGFSYILISHDLGVVRYVSHQVAVMYLGEIVEAGPARLIYENPIHPYTRSLLSAVPVADPRRRRKRIILEGDVPSPIDPPPGCRFHLRCPVRIAICSEQKPPMLETDEGQRAACHLFTEGRTLSPT